MNKDSTVCDNCTEANTLMAENQYLKAKLQDVETSRCMIGILLLIILFLEGMHWIGVF